MARKPKLGSGKRFRNLTHSSMIDESRKKLRQGPEDEEKATFIHEAESKEAKFLVKGFDRA